jgi:putative oxidoreductase
MIRVASAHLSRPAGLAALLGSSTWLSEPPPNVCRYRLVRRSKPGGFLQTCRLAGSRTGFRSINHKESLMNTFEKTTELAARILLSVIFVRSGFSKIGTFADTQAYMESAGVPGALLPLVIILEIAGGIAIIIGWQTRYAALALAAFTLVAGFLFHSDFADRMQMIMFLKNLGIAGGFLLLAVHGAGEISVDARSGGSGGHDSKEP